MRVVFNKLIHAENTMICSLKLICQKKRIILTGRAGVAKKIRNTLLYSRHFLEWEDVSYWVQNFIKFRHSHLFRAQDRFVTKL